MDGQYFLKEGKDYSIQVDGGAATPAGYFSTDNTCVFNICGSSGCHMNPVVSFNLIW